MNNQYKDEMNKIQASELFKRNMIEKMNKKQEEINLEKNKKILKKIKIRNTIFKLIGAGGILLGSGFAYATITGNLKLGNVEFSEQISEYREDVINQKVKKDGNIIELKSKVCDDGFVVLQFDVSLSDEESKRAEETCGLQYLSFNDKIINEYGIEETRLAGANYNLIIDGKECWMRGATDFDIIENIANKNYTFYQLWFLSDEEIGNKEDFTITLKDIRMMVGEKLISFDDYFDIDLSKSRAVNNSKIYTPQEGEFNYGRLTHKIEKIIETPMQILIKTNTILEDVTKKNFSKLSADDYIGMLQYKVYDENGNELSEFDLITKYVYYYPDGTKKETDNEEGIEYNRFYRYDTQEYIAIAQNSEMKKIKIDVLEKNDYTGITRKIGTYSIDLTNGKVNGKNKNEIIDREDNPPMDWERNYIDKDKIEEFSIDIPDKDYKINETYEKVVANTDVIEVYDEGHEITKEEADTIQYEVELEDTEADFTLIFFKTKKAKDFFDKNHMYVGTYDLDGNPEFAPITVDKNDNGILVLNAFSKENYELIKDIIATIKLK